MDVDERECFIVLEELSMLLAKYDRNKMKIMNSTAQQMKSAMCDYTQLHIGLLCGYKPHNNREYAVWTAATTLFLHNGLRIVPHRLVVYQRYYM